MDFFFDWRTNFIKPYADEYLECMGNVDSSDPESLKQAEEVRGNLRNKIIRHLGKDAKEIRQEHLKLSHSFGIALGLANNYKYISFSVLDCCKENSTLIESKKFPSKNYLPSSFASNLLNCLKVISLNIFSQNRMFLCYKYLDSFLQYINFQYHL